MAERPDSLETIKTALALLQRIPRRPRRVSAPELHAQLQAVGINRDMRSVQRQLKMLTEQFEIECDTRSKPYGYCWKEKAQGFSMPGLSEQESLLLSLAEQHLRNLLPASLLTSMGAFFEQARSNLLPALPPSANKRSNKSSLERQWLQKVRVVSATQPLLPPSIDDTVFKEVSNALFSNHMLDIKYRNRAGTEQNAMVMPLGLAQQGEILYLVCRFDGFDNERSLAMHRFISARATTLSFARPKGFDLQKYDNDGRFAYGEGKRIALRFRISKQAGLHLLEARLSADQQVREVDDGYEISATVMDTKQLDWWLWSFGESVSGVEKTPA